jgi:predicted alpha/beta-hydrolase family hydrolase
VLRERIEALESELAQILGATQKTGKVGRPRKGMSAARWKISLAQKRRRAKSRKPKRTMSAAARARIAAAAKLRWKRAKAAGRTKL